ncbi:hypothetical protein C8R44DRAFT_987837 [Mycena epipterygia]|nr:hypothetical protein C8R44DRAFT_987837 [Mycena epipterygia]
MASPVTCSRPDSKAFPLLLLPLPLKKLVMSKFAASRTPFPLSSFIDDADSEPDVDLDEFFNPPSKKCKGTPASKKGPAATPASPAVAGPSSTLHPHLRLIQFTPTESEKPTIHFTAKEQQLVQHNVEAVGHGQTILDDRISKVQHDLTAGFEGVDARLVGMAAPTVHTANLTAMGTAINDAYVRIRQVEEIAGSITSLTATVAQLGTTFQAVLHQLSASSGIAPPAMSGDDAALINAALNPNGKHAHEEDDDSVKRQHLDTGVTLPDSFVPPPPGPVFASPAFAPAAVASPTVFVLPTPPPAPVYAATAPAYIALHRTHCAWPPRSS